MIKCQLTVIQECVSTRARAAIGYQAGSLNVNMGEPADFVLFGHTYSERAQESRERKTIQEIVYDASPARLMVRSGSVLSRRRRR